MELCLPAGMVETDCSTPFQEHRHITVEAVVERFSKQQHHPVLEAWAAADPGVKPP
jgi:hypothetical protein